MTRQSLRRILGLLWLVDAALQCQPFMFGSGFSADVLRPAADGQPVVVAAPIHFASSLVQAHPVALNLVFAGVQLLLGVGLLSGRAVRTSLVASIGWGLSVWWLGEGLGGLLSGHAMLLTGAPGAALVYAVAGVAAWPRTSAQTTQPDRVSPSFAAGAWAGIWLAGAIFQLLPGQNNGQAVRAAIRASADDAPGWAAHIDSFVAGHLPRGAAVAVALAVLQALLGLAALRPGFSRRLAVTTGIALTGAFWLVGQSLGELTTGQATDPQTAPLLMLLGATLVTAQLSRRREPLPSTARHTVALTADAAMPST